MSEAQRLEGEKRIKNLNPNLKVLKYINSKTPIKVKCLKCGKIYEITSGALIRRNGRCSYCENIVAGNVKEKISKYKPELKEWFVNEFDFYTYGISSKKITEFKCPDCGEEFKEKISNFCKRKNLCPNCYKDNISRPNKFLRAFLNEVKDQLIQKDLEWNPDWGEKYLWDAHIITKDNIEITIEMQGEQHYHETNWGRHDYQLKRDKDKIELFKKVNIEQIDIDCSNTKFDFIKEKILESKLNKILDLSKINWNNIYKETSKNYVKIASEMYNQGKTISNISIELDLERHTISKLLYDAKEIGWCDYIPIPLPELYKQDVKIIDKETEEIIIIHGVNEACKWIKEKYNFPIDRHTMRDYIRGERIIYYGGKHIESLKDKLYKNRFKFEIADSDPNILKGT